MNKRRREVRILLIIMLDCLMITLAGGVGLLVRFDFSFDAVPSEFVQQWWNFLPLQLLLTVLVFFLRKMYHYVWHSVNIHDVMDMLLSVLLAFGATEVAKWLLHVRLPISVVFISLMCQLFTLVGMRCGIRFLVAFRQALNRTAGKERIMLVGAGEAGKMLLQELNTRHQSEGKVCCVIDDNPIKKGKYLDGVKIVGGREEIPGTVKKEGITQIIFAIPTAKPEQKKAILDICQSTGCRVRVLPGIYQLVNGAVSLSAVKDIQVEDLLGRAPVKLESPQVDDLLGGKTVLVTGGGGSIGGELCRQIVRHKPRRLVILDIYENNAYDIQQELRLTCPRGMDLCVEIASIRDKERIDEIFASYRPAVVFHAAAHKHVPLMESCPAEAIKNNVFGTWHVVRAAEKTGVQKFVMISTDKAVNPTNFMGATKRFCEMMLQSKGQSTTAFCAVRFGNVLGSNGSVVPLFKRQIEAGGPVTITDKRIIRYFMTIPEAAQLVLEAGAMAERGQIYVLDMGEPVKILKLAENLIRLSGLEPYEDIKIEEVGLRPGEKLYEELLTANSNLSQTANQKIFVEHTEHIPVERVYYGLQQLDNALQQQESSEELIRLMKELIPTYQDPDACNRSVEQENPNA